MGKALRWLRSLLGGGASKKTTSTNVGHTRSGEARPKDEDRTLARSFRDEDRTASVGGRREVAVAAASAAVAQAAVATAQAAAAVVKLAVGSGRASCGGSSRRIGEEMAAVKIQRVFRGYLARRALKALKGVVKLQALVRGHIVRKQAAETFKCMRALLKAQARARSCRQSFANPSSLPYRDYYLSPQTPHSTTRPNAAAQQLERLSFSQRTISRTTDSAVVDSNMLQSPSWKWLDQWMEQLYWDTQGKTTFPTSRATSADDSPNVKIVEVDSVMRPQPLPMSNARWSYTDYYPASPCKPSSHRFAASPAADGGESCDGSSHFFSASSRTRRGAFSPTTSEGSGSFLSFYAGYPNYMAYTESAKAKARSSSAPKQRAQEVEQPFPARRGAAAPAGGSAYSGSLHGGTRLEYYGMNLRERMEMEVGQ